MGKEQIGHTDFLFEDMMDLAICLNGKMYFFLIDPTRPRINLLIYFIFKYLFGINPNENVS